MIISLNQLKKYINLDGISTEEIEEKLTNSGLEVESVIDKKKKYENFVVGFVKEKNKHPNADKLSLCIVNDGAADYSVVCGASNVAQGQKIAFAKVGAIIPNGNFEIKKAKIRGEISLGMICAEDELGLSDDHSGIMVLNENLEAGTPLSEALGIDDVIIEISITPNRADALSHIGTARDLAALLNRELILPEIKYSEAEIKSTEEAAIEIKNSNLCKRYVGKVVKNIEVKESPEWLKKHLTTIGLRPINNIVDVTNFVLHEIGQPLHAFDIDKLSGKKIIVQNAQAGKTFTTLDSKERKLEEDFLMICDAEKPVAIAGVMGGKNSEVTENTKNILIESAYFDPSSIRKTAKKLGLSTDASYRFERGCDPNITLWAAKRAAQLIVEVSGGTICSGEIDIYPEPIKEKETVVRFSRVKRVLGFDVLPSKIKEYLHRLGFEICEETEEFLKIKIPTFRHDVEREIDIIEEIARIYGYNNIDIGEKIFVTLDRKTDESYFANNTREIISGMGFNEILTNSLLNEETAKIFGKPISVLNPQNQGMTDLRTSLLPGALSTISKNIKVKKEDLKLYEIGHIFNRTNDNELNDFEDFEEIEILQLTISGKAIKSSWYHKERTFDFFDLKGFAKEFISKLKINSCKEFYFQTEDDIFEYGFSFSIKNKEIGKGGKLKKEILSKFDIGQEVYAFNFNLTELKKAELSKLQFKELLKYPKVVKDFAFILDRHIPNDKIISVIKKVTSNLLKNINLFDIFESKNFGYDKRSMAYQLEFYDESRTLTEEEVDKEFRKAIEAVKKELNGELRGE